MLALLCRNFPDFMASARQGNIGLRSKVNSLWDRGDVTASTGRGPVSWRPCRIAAPRHRLFAGAVFRGIVTPESASREKPDGHEHWPARSLQCVDPQAERNGAVLRGRAGLQERSAPAIRFPRRLAL